MNAPYVSRLASCVKKSLARAGLQVQYEESGLGNNFTIQGWTNKMETLDMILRRHDSLPDALNLTHIQRHPTHGPC